MMYYREKLLRNPYPVFIFSIYTDPMIKFQDNGKVAIAREIDDEIPNVVLSSQVKASGHTRSPSPEEEEKEPVSIVQKGINVFFDFLETIVIALSIFVVIYLFLVQPHEVKGISMEPNFHNNEYILTDKLSYKFKPPQRGDVVIFKAPNNPEVDYIKRIIAIPGEKVKISGGYVYVNGNKLNEYYLKDPTNLFPSSKMKEGVEITVGNEEYFVLGDNRQHSSDSREFGPIDRNLIVGKAFMRYWPLADFGVLPHISY